MNITRSNFAQALPLIMDCLKKSHFVAVDFEMTGISSHHQLKNSNIDSIQLRYWKSKENIKKFLPIQIGLCSFELTSEKNIIAYPFNFYIYPLPLEESVDRRFLCQASSMYFLSTHSFDFNTLFHDGIYYLNHEEVKTLEASKAMQKTKQKLRELSKILTPEMQTFTKLNLPKVREFMDNHEAKTLQIPIQYIKVKVYKHLEQQIFKLWPNIPLVIEYDSQSFLKRKNIILRKVTQEELEAIKAQEAANPKHEATEEDIDPIGFRKVIDHISELKLPLIVHNGFLDIMHLYDKFFNPLPETHKEFKMMFKKQFPILYDTKYMFNNSNILSSEVGAYMDLGTYFKAILKYHNQEPKVEICKDFEDYQLIGENEDSCENHEAGYDALITGYVFFKSLGILNLYNSIFDKTFAKRMKFYENRVPLGGIKVPFNLNFEDDIYKDDTMVFYLANDQAALKFDEIKAYFEKKFGLANLYQIYGNRLEYFLIFQKHESAVKMKEWLNSTGGETTCKSIRDISIYFQVYLEGESGKGTLMLQSFEKYELNLKNKVLGDMENLEMPKVFQMMG